MLYVIWWRESNCERVHSTFSGLETVLLKPRVCSRLSASTYDALQVNAVLKLVGAIDRRSCLLVLLRSDVSWLTRLKLWLIFASRTAIAPVVVTMLVGFTYTGRLPSSLS